MKTKVCAEFLGIRVYVWCLIIALAASGWSLLLVFDDEYVEPRPAQSVTSVQATKASPVLHGPEETPPMDVHLPHPEPQRLAEFMNILSSPLAEDRRNAAIALSRLGLAAKAAVPKLTDLALNDVDETVRAR